MKNLVTYLFFGLACTLWLNSYFFMSEIIDIQLHDTYYVFRYKDLSLFCSLFLLVMSLLYFLIQMKLSLKKWMSITHFILTGFAIISIFLSIIYVNFFIEPQRYYSLVGETRYNIGRYINLIVTFLALSFSIAQLLFLFNVILSLFSPRKTL